QQALAEARTIVSLKHPHIVPVHYFDVDVSTGQPFLVMDYASGGNLRQWHPEGTLLPLATICNYVGQLADALAYAHQRQIIHCDIKPENMLIGQRGDVLLSDFGIAAVNPSFPYLERQELQGTVEYMAPEIFDRRPSPKSDQYALGVVVYEWLCGNIPFSADTLLELIQQHMQKPAPSLTQRMLGLSPEIEQVIFRALEKDPAARFPGVEDFALALSNACRVPYGYASVAPSATITLTTSSSNQIATPAVPVQVQPVQTPARRPARRTFFIVGLASSLIALGGAAWWITAARSSALPPCMPSSSPTIASDGVMTAGVLLWGADPGTDNTPSSGGAPYVFLNDNGDPVGFEVDIANAIAQLMGITQEFYHAQYTSLDSNLQSRQMDIILNGWEITTDHLRDETFSVPYYRYSQQLVVRANDALFSQYTLSSQITLAELKRYTFGTGAGYKAFDLLQAAGIKVLSFDDPVGALKSGQVDIIMIDMPIVAYYIQGIGLDATGDNTLRPIGKSLFADSTSNYVIGFRKNDPDADKLRMEIDNALSTLKQNGTLKRIYQQWGLWNEFQTEIGIVDCV
ncbi:MAG TPA: transporter substrate-binding domain-containing protein, partial [Ktedonobacteraceae bacterium]|nr:transporter substrate-binding domain-containing protein [Ktedonobacteraceae bacterium]